MDTEVIMNQQYALVAKKANNTLACTSKSIASRLREDLLLCSFLVRPRLGCFMQFWVPHYKTWTY